MLWNVIYEFFVMYIFGGYLGETDYFATLGGLFSFENGSFDSIEELGTSDVVALSFEQVQFKDFVSYMSLGNYLSLIATIISMVVIVILCCLLIKKIYNICAHIIG